MEDEAPTNRSGAEHMFWAAGRRTSRTEDMAYCLLGIFGISMPLLYGEGDRAFLRLQEEIIRQYDDYSFMVWSSLNPRSHHPRHSSYGLLAKTSADFGRY